MNEFFHSNPRRVKPLSDTEDGVRPAEFSHSQDSAQDSEPAHGATRRAKEYTAVSDSPSPLPSDAAYYRSFRTLSRTIIISNALTALSVIIVALIFSSSLQRIWNSSQEHLIAVVENLRATNQTSAAKQDQENAALKSENAAIRELLTKSLSQVQRIATTAEALAAKDKSGQQRIAVLSRVPNVEKSNHVKTRKPGNKRLHAHCQGLQ